MPHIKQLSKSFDKVVKTKNINWFPGHMHSGLQAIFGKLNTVDCVVEVHDARIPFIGRNAEFKKHLGLIKPHLLILNKSDLADLSRWESVKKKLFREGDENVLLTDSTGSQFSHNDRGYNKLLERVIKLINKSDRFNRELTNHYKIMIVGIPNVGKSTIINRLRQHHLGIGGQPAKCGPEAGVTKHVNNMIKICSRPLIYSLDTPGILEPGSTNNTIQAMQLGLCSTINDRVLDRRDLAEYLLKHLNETENFTYLDRYKLDTPVFDLNEFVYRVFKSLPELAVESKSTKITGDIIKKPDIDRIFLDFIKAFRVGLFGRVMFE